MGTDKKNVKYELTPEMKEKLDAVRNHYVKNYTEKEKQKYFNGLNKVSYVTALTKQYTSINRLKARHIYGYPPYNLLYEYEIKNDTVYNAINRGDTEYLTTLMRWTGINHYKLVANYKPRYVYDIFDKIGNIKNYYDFSCGWGVRLLCSLGRHINYYGTDPNTDLCNNLYKMTEDYRYYTGDNQTTVDIRNTGSEVYHSDWTGKMDICFSSPPYFNLETYEEDNENQSIYNRTYDEWITEYVIPTIMNCYKYLKDDGSLVVNISNTKAINDIEEKVNEAVLKCNFYLVEKLNILQTTVLQNKSKKQEFFYIYKKKVI